MPSGSFILDYFILVFWASCGVFQLAAAYNGMHGLLFFRDRRLSFLLGLALIGGAFAWFFLSTPRNVPDSGPGMNGNEQFGYFFAGSGAGLAFTLLVSSLCNRELGRGRLSLPSGMDALRESNYLRALYRRLRPLVSIATRPLVSIATRPLVSIATRPLVSIATRPLVPPCRRLRPVRRRGAPIPSGRMPHRRRHR